MFSQLKESDFMGFFSKNNNETIQSKCCGGTTGCQEIQIEQDNDVRELAYFKWLAATGGNPVSEEESQKFWLEAEAETQLFFN
jgi:hypothetical protein